MRKRCDEEREVDSPLMVVVEVGMFVGRGGRDVVGRGMVFAVVRLWVGYVVVVARGKEDEVKRGGGGGGDVVKEDDDGSGEDGCECRRDDFPFEMAPRGGGSGVPSSTVGTVVLSSSSSSSS
jgi:hypothetical protein